MRLCARGLCDRKGDALDFRHLLSRDVAQASLSPMARTRMHLALGDLLAGTKVAQGISSEHTLAAAEKLRSFDGTALIVWGTRDKFFPLADAERLEQLFPDARLELIDDARAFVQLDAPKRLAELILELEPAIT